MNDWQFLDDIDLQICIVPLSTDAEEPEAMRGIQVSADLAQELISICEQWVYPEGDSATSWEPTWLTVEDSRRLRRALEEAEARATSAVEV